MVRRLDGWYDWFTRARQCEDSGAILVIHPWESGRDNLSDWDPAMAAVVPDTGLGDYRRRDLEHVDASQRPTKEEYDRYLTIVRFGRDCGWDQAHLGKHSPFRMIDPGMTAMLLRSERDLVWLQAQTGQDISATKARIKRLEEGWRSLWNRRVKRLYQPQSEHWRADDAVSAASFLGPYAGMVDHLGETLDHFRPDSRSQVEYMIPSFDPVLRALTRSGIGGVRVWHVINNRIGLGLQEIGELDRSERVRRDTARLTEKSGFSEYFDPLTGEGSGR